MNGGGLKGALLGGLGSAAGVGLAQPGGLGSVFGSAAGSPLGGGLQGATQGTGVLGSVTRAAPGLSSAFGGIGDAASGAFGSSTGGGGFGSLIQNAIGSYAQDESIQDAEQAQLRAIQEAQGNIGQFNPDEYINSPEYQFQQEQGTRGLDAANAARGNFYSGAALKEALGYNQGLSNQYYNQAYNRYGNETDQRNDLLLRGGDVRGQADLLRGNTLSGALLGGI
jgi:hypothetical protein